MKFSIFFKIFFYFSVIYIFSILIGFFVIHPTINTLLVKSLKDKSISIVNTSKSFIDKALETNDDVLVLSHIENISKISDVLEAYIINPSGLVLYHNNTTEWGKIYDTPFLKKAYSDNQALFQDLKDGNYLLSVPLVLSNILCIKISGNRVYKSLKDFNKDYILSFLVISIFALGGFFILLKKKLKDRFSYIFESLNLLTLNNKSINLLGDDEFSKIAKLINDILIRYENECVLLRNDRDKLEFYFRTYLKEICKFFPMGILLIDKKNHIMCFNQKAIDYIGFNSQNILDKHILDVFKNKQIIDFIQKSHINLDTHFVQNIDGICLRIVTPTNIEGQSLGTIVVVE